MQNLTHRTSSATPLNTHLMRKVSAPSPSANYAHRLFEAQAAAQPDAVAVVYGDTHFTYSELNDRANQLAHELVRSGVRADSLVAICVERSPQMVIGVLAILKAGGAYLPLDPAYPQERLDFMLHDSGARVLLTENQLADRFVNYHGRRFCLDSDGKEVEANSSDNPDIEITPENLAYVIYTSGSTGQPKGAMITHRGLTNYLTWAVETYDVASGIGAPLHSSISFDLTVTSLFTPLLAGRSVFLLPEGIEALAQALLARTNYSLVKITPAHLRALDELLPSNEVAGRVRALIIGGEALHFQSLAFWREHAPATRLINEYGPTETVVGCCVYEVAPGDPLFGPVPIGHPIANTTLCVLDDTLHSVGPGETGELFIGGEGVARGYLNREELTRERFVSSHDHRRLYRTGDLARRLPDGNYEYAGRVDDQVKIRGYRIELGEIETVIKQHATVHDCVVLVHEVNADDKRLIAFIAPSEAGAWDESTLRESLKKKLPEYMLPAAFVQMERLPLTVNGKIDRTSLALHVPAISTNDDFVAARSPVEQTLATIWSDVLHVDRIGVTDNFFDLGGDSILGTLILARAARAGLKLSPIQLFEHQTIAALAAVAIIVG